jgi:phytanoyl-CoA hydroxylase
MFMNKPAHHGSDLPWHQDRWNQYDREPLVTVWTALDRCTVHNGCLQIVPRSHRSIINPGSEGGFITPEQEEEVLATLNPLFLELEEGEAVLLHNHTLHTSATNSTDQSRRAFSVCYIDAATVASNGATFPVIFGKGALDSNLLDSATKT